jgi:hypothetical protein
MNTTHEDDSHQHPNYYRLFEGIRGFKSNEHIPKQEFFAQLGKSNSGLTGKQQSVLLHFNIIVSTFSVRI